MAGQLYYNGAQGWFRIWDGLRENLQQYGIGGHFDAPADFERPRAEGIAEGVELFGDGHVAMRPATCA